MTLYMLMEWKYLIYLIAVSAIIIIAYIILMNANGDK